MILHLTVSCLGLIVSRRVSGQAAEAAGERSFVAWLAFLSFHLSASETEGIFNCWVSHVVDCEHSGMCILLARLDLIGSQPYT